MARNGPQRASHIGARRSPSPSSSSPSPRVDARPSRVERERARASAGRIAARRDSEGIFFNNHAPRRWRWR